MTIETALHYLSTHAIKFFLILIPAGFFVFTDSQLLIMQSLLWIIVLDTILGTILAIKLKVFSSVGMGRFVRKVIPYGITLLTVHLADNVLVTGDNLLFLAGSYLILKETMSNLEKSKMLNVPIPQKLIDLLGMDINDIEKAREKWKKRGKK